MVVIIIEHEQQKDAWKAELRDFSEKNGYDINRNGDSCPLLLDVLEGFLKFEAELRASVFEAIKEEDNAIEKDKGLPPALLGSCNDRAKQLHASPSGRLLTALVCEYLDWAELSHTLKVYLPECNLIVKLLAYISDKDLFVEFYRKNLARMLLFDRSTGDEHERSILAKLKQQCGGQFASKIPVV